MDIALLFNSDDPSLGGFYGQPIGRAILGTGILQKSDREIRVSVGDIVFSFFCGGSLTKLRELIGKTFVPIEFDRLKKGAFPGIAERATVYCWLLENCTSHIATMLDDALCSFPPYLGAMDVDFSNPVHNVFFRNSLIEHCRLVGTSCYLAYQLGENEDPDTADIELFQSQGFVVSHEDIGIRRTIFDNYDTAEHFSRVRDFKRVFRTIDGLSEDRTSDLALRLEEIHPELFNSLSAAALTMENADTSEQIAQASLSGRRFLEQLANCLYPPRPTNPGERKLGNAEFKNRLWAYLEEVLLKKNRSAELASFGKELDQLVVEFNSGLHAAQTHDEIADTYRRLVQWLLAVTRISPVDSRKPYLPNIAVSKK